MCTAVSRASAQEAVRRSGVWDHANDAFRNRLIHVFDNSILVQTIGCLVFTSNAEFSTKFELSPVVGSETFQLSTRLIFNHREPV